RRQAGEAPARARRGLAAAGARIGRLGREVEWSRESAERAATELAARDTAESDLRGRLAAAPTAGVEQEQTVARLQARLTDLEAATREQTERVMSFRNNVAVIEGERRAQTRLLEGYEERRRRAADEVDARRRR